MVLLAVSTPTIYARLFGPIAEQSQPHCAYRPAAVWTGKLSGMGYGIDGIGAPVFGVAVENANGQSYESGAPPEM